VRIRTSITASRVARATRVMVMMGTSDIPADLITNQVTAERITSSAGPAGPPHRVAEAATNKRQAGSSWPSDFHRVLLRASVRLTT